MPTLADAWNVAADSTPPGWHIEGLRCTSTGLEPERRGNRWLAEACGPNEGCLKIERADPAEALRDLSYELRMLRRAETG